MGEKARFLVRSDYAYEAQGRALVPGRTGYAWVPPYCTLQFEVHPLPPHTILEDAGTPPHIILGNAGTRG